MDNYPRHIVAALGLVTNAEGKILLVRTQVRGWEFPGGQIELGEDIPAGLQREIEEESGCRAEVGRLIGVYSSISPPTKVIFAFRCRYQSGDLATSEETPETGWFDRDQAVTMVTESPLLDRLRDALAEKPGVIYRVYRNHPYRIISERII